MDSICTDNDDSSKNPNANRALVMIDVHATEVGMGAPTSGIGFRQATAAHVYRIDFKEAGT